MRLLLDTRACLWSLSDPDRLTADVADAIADPANDVRVSAASAWEIAIKQSLGKLELPGPADAWLPEAVERTGFEWLPITPADALRVGTLPWLHRDPFDRLLVAQAADGFTIVTHDERIRLYDVSILMT